MLLRAIRVIGYLLYFPFSPQVNDQGNKASGAKDIEQIVGPVWPLLKKRVILVNADISVHQHPQCDHGDRLHDPQQELLCFIFNAHDYFSSNLLKAVLSPLNTLKSTVVSIPFTWPLSLCCQKIHLRFILGLSSAR